MTNGSVSSIFARMSFNITKKYKKMLFLISYFGDTPTKVAPNGIFYTPISGNSENLKIEKYGEIAGSITSYSYFSYFLTNGLEIGEKVYASIGFSLNTSTTSSVKEYIIVTAIGLN